VVHAYASGTGDAIASGGRYDELLARFGWDLPAAGFAIDLDRAAEALGAAGVGPQPPPRAVVVGPADDGRLTELRAAGIVAVAQEASAAMAWARAWGFTHVLDSSGWVDAASGASIPSPLSREERGEK
jgi:ATP phosphoribosyltransferase regulatory subunit